MTPNSETHSVDVPHMRIDLATVRALTNLIAVSMVLGVAGLAVIAHVFPQVPTVVFQFTAVVAVASGLVVAAIWAGIAVSLSIRVRLDNRR